MGFPGGKKISMETEVSVTDSFIPHECAKDTVHTPALSKKNPKLWAFTFFLEEMKASGYTLINFFLNTK